MTSSQKPPESPKTVAGSHATHSGVVKPEWKSEYAIKGMDLTSPKGASTV